METMRLRVIQLRGNLGALLDSFMLRRYDQFSAIEEHKDTWQRCNP